MRTLWYINILKKRFVWKVKKANYLPGGERMG